MAGIALEALDDVPWERLDSAPAHHHPPEEMRQALRRLALGAGAATEEDCYPLFDCFALGTGRLASVATAALPFVVALACDQDMGARVTLVQLLASLSTTAAEADPGLVDAGWHEQWRLQRPRKALSAGFRHTEWHPAPTPVAIAYW